MTRDQYDRARKEVARWDRRSFAPPTATAVLALAEAVLAVAEALRARPHQPPAEGEES